MSLNVVTYAMSKKFTEDSLIGLGCLRGKPVTIKSTTKKNGQTEIVFEWVALQPDGVTEVKQETKIYIDDGTPIYVWTSGNTYKYGDLCIYNSCFYRCITENSDITFDDIKWNEIGSPDGSYDIAQDYSKLPPRFTSADRKIYYCINNYVSGSILYKSGYYLWNGTTWTRTLPEVLDRFTEVDITDSTGTVIGHELYFDGKHVITEDNTPYRIVDTYADIDTTVADNTMFFVKNATGVGTTAVHYSGNYMFDATAKTITFVNERESEEIDFDDASQYKPIEEGSVV